MNRTGTPVIKRLVLKIVALTALISTAYTLILLDQLVNDTLYSYGLQFSYTWANPYWTLLRVTWTLLAVSATAITINTIIIIRSGPKEKQQKVETAPIRKIVRDTRPIIQAKEKTGPISIAPGLPSPPRPTPKPMPTTTPAPPSHTGPDAPALFKCAHCGKTFTQPLRMLNFHVDPPRIVNVCPFCNETMPARSTVKETEHDENRSLFRRDNGHTQKPLTQ